jgi:hypothetical protein
MAAGRTPVDFGEHLVRRVQATRADVVVIGKGWHDAWFVPPGALARVRRSGARVVFLSWDDPDQVPTACRSGMLRHADAVGTCCPDQARSVGPLRAFAPGARVFLFWPGWDQVAWEPGMQERVEETCDLMLGGSPYYRPTSEYAGPPRREIAWAAIRRGWKVEVWGGREWLDERHGGDPKLEPWFRGPYGYADRGRIWRRARVVVNTHIRHGVPGYLNDRFFMVGGAGRALLCDDQPEVWREFPEPAYFRGGDMEDLMAKATDLLEDAGYRASMGTALRHRILSSHTLAHRADAILAALGEAA